MEADLLGDGAPLLDRIASGAVDHADEDPGPLDVPEEVVTKPAALRGPLDEAWHVGDDRPPLLVECDHPQVRGEGRERIVPDLGARLGERREKGRLAGVGSPHEADVRDELQLQLDPALLARGSLLGVLRRAVGGGGEVHVATAAAAPAGDHQPGIGLQQLACEHTVGMGTDDRAGRHAHHRVAAAAPGRLAPGAVAAVDGLEVALALEIAERGHAGVHHQDHAAAVAAVAAVRPAARHVRLATERAGAVTTIATGDVDPSAIREHGCRA